MGNTFTFKSTLGVFLCGSFTMFPDLSSGTEPMSLPQSDYVLPCSKEKVIENYPTWDLIRYNMGEFKSNKEKILNDFVKSILNKSVPLDEDFSKIIDDNFCDLI